MHLSLKAMPKLVQSEEKYTCVFFDKCSLSPRWFKKKIKKQFLSINWVPLLQKTPLFWFYLGPFDNHRCPGWDFCHWVALKYIETRKTLWKGIYTLSLDSGEVFHEGGFLKDFYNLLFDSELWNWEKVILIWLCYNTCFALLILLSI